MDQSSELYPVTFASGTSKACLGIHFLIRGCLLNFEKSDVSACVCVGGGGYDRR